MVLHLFRDSCCIPVGMDVLQAIKLELEGGMPQVVKDPFLKQLIDLECFVLSGLLADRSGLSQSTLLMIGTSFV